MEQTNQATVPSAGTRSTNDPFASILGTTRGSDRVYPTAEQEAAERDELLQREVDADGTVRYRNHEGALHRETGPAMELVDGARLWYLLGKRHRVDEPTLEWPTGRREWWVHGELQREGG